MVHGTGTTGIYTGLMNSSAAMPDSSSLIGLDPAQWLLLLLGRLSEVTEGSTKEAVALVCDIERLPGRLPGRLGVGGAGSSEECGPNPKGALTGNLAFAGGCATTPATEPFPEGAGR